ncbi:MAG TPA: SRPBCC family protein [Gemmatimonadaceae bacterium]
MPRTVDSTADVPVRKSVTVNASAARAFQIFTEGLDSWWPRTHHIGSSPMTRAIMECRAGGRCYSEQEDGTTCDWGQVLAWEPPRRFVMAWMINGEWQYEPDLAKSSEVEVRFTPLPDGSTRVDLEHRYFHRHGTGAGAMRTGVGGNGGWGDLLQLFAAAAESSNRMENAR